jgi:hypothetical protein
MLAASSRGARGFGPWRPWHPWHPNQGFTSLHYWYAICRFMFLGFLTLPHFNINATCGVGQFPNWTMCTSSLDISFFAMVMLTVDMDQSLYNTCWLVIYFLRVKSQCVSCKSTHRVRGVFFFIWVWNIPKCIIYNLWYSLQKNNRYSKLHNIHMVYS